MVKVVTANKGGVPDILSCIDGKFVAFEVKTDKGRLTPLQELNIGLIRENGGYAYVVKSLDDVKKIVECITKRARADEEE